MMTSKSFPRRIPARAKAKLNSTVIERLRTTLTPCRERFGFEFTMKRWSDEVRRDRSVYRRRTKKRVRSRGRPYDDPGRFAALLLAVIFEEYTGRRPGRTTRWTKTDTKLRDKDYPFHNFCREACDAAGLFDASDKAFVEAIAELSGRGHWEANVPALRLLLWGELQMADADCEQVRSRFSMALDAIAEGKLLSDTVLEGPSQQATIGRALIDAIHLREPLHDEEVGRAGRALDRLRVDARAISAPSGGRMRKDQIAEFILEGLRRNT
jgi:hypothetical protein